MITKITINDDNIIGNEIQSKLFINLTSVSDQVLSTILSRISSLSDNYRYLRMNDSTIYDSKTCKPIKNKYKGNKPVTFIVDENDHNHNVKIKKLSKYMKVTCVTKIIIYSKMKIIKESFSVTGKVTRCANYHHTKQVMDTLRCVPMSVNAMAQGSFITIVKTGGTRCGGTSAMMMYCNTMNKHYEVEETYVEYNKTWVDTIKLNIIAFEDDNIVSDKTFDKDNQWYKKLGYMEYTMTNRGIKKSICQKKTEKKGLYDKIVWIYYKIKEYIVEIYNKIFRKNDKTNNTTLAFSFTNTMMNVSPHAASVLTTLQPKNASKDIKKANKAIASMQLNKMMSRTGLSGDKTILREKRSSAFDAYITAITSFNVNDALTLANNLAASRYKTIRMICILSTIGTMLPYCIITGKMAILMISIIVMMVDYYTDILPGNNLLYALSILTSGSFIQFCINMFALMVDITIKDSKTSTYRSMFFLILTCLVSLK